MLIYSDSFFFQLFFSDDDSIRPFGFILRSRWRIFQSRHEIEFSDSGLLRSNSATTPSCLLPASYGTERAVLRPAPSFPLCHSSEYVDRLFPINHGPELHHRNIRWYWGPHRRWPQSVRRKGGSGSPQVSET